MSILINASALQERVDSQTVILDCRYDLADSKSGRWRYLQGHIHGAHYLSLDDDCCAPIGTHGGRHPLPSVTAMAALFGRLGIERNTTHVVCLDDENGCFAARVWWMLRYLGHEKVNILNGGFTAWRRAGGAIEKEIPTPHPVVFQPQLQVDMLAEMEWVRDGNAMLLLDCRAEERYRGEHEPIDPIAGHIPGAINIPWQDFVTAGRRFRDVATFAELLTGIDERSAVYCGSGVTACVAVLAAAEAGLGIPRLYAGGWSDWITWEGNEIAIDRRMLF